jgi:hypothetical protein
VEHALLVQALLLQLVLLGLSDCLVLLLVLPLQLLLPRATPLVL